ncbi:ATP-binding cassette sub-family A member 2-like [Chelonus insularis]|uniref:ATP-binding cassette sub-family A member 2-like n=1 Tax=Chelonus insularis TaxID=460826 RepID=UPI00158A15CF|nr:ATP-binding cassette sub-family A member 2-like [Chelonus insularis]
MQKINFYNGHTILNSIQSLTACYYTPSNEFTDNIIQRTSEILNISITPKINEYEFLSSIYGPNRSVVPEEAAFILFEPSSESLPEVLNYEIRANVHEDSRDGDEYFTSGFMAIQVAIERSFIELWSEGDLPYSGENIKIARFPHYHIRFPILPSAVRPKISLIYYLTVLSYLLIPISGLHKAIHDKKTGFKAFMKLSGINPAFIYFGWINYLMITAVPTVFFCTWILHPIYSSSSIVLAIFILMYIMMSAFFIFAVGTFFVHSIRAILACILLWLAMAHYTILLDESLIDSSLTIKIISLFFPHSGLLYGLVDFTYKSQFDDGVEIAKPRFWQSKYHDSKLSEDMNRISISAVIISWLFHLIAWYLIAIYLDNVYPGKFGTRKPWYYLCKRKRNNLNDINVTLRGSTNWSSVERPPKFVKPKVRVKKVTIEFGFEKLEVLKDMTIDFYPNEFNVILGHNGAGKSSLLKIIAGIYQASRGHIYIEGRDYTDTKSSEKKTKSIIGYCPQENMLVTYLSVYEHLYLAGMIKGLDYEESQVESKSLLKLLRLEKEKNQLINELTFGKKRKLCLAIALIGYSEVLVLDEPTYGVDPQHRKRLWEILGKVKGKKTVIMATNSMEAADTLADRIAIIANSRIECYGSKSYLNRRYKIGYELTIVIKPGCDLQNLHNRVQDYSASLVNLTGKMGMMVHFNMSRNTRFAKLFSFLEMNKEELKISSVSLHPASIEGQFRKIGLISHFKERKAWFPSDGHEWILQQRRRKLIQDRNHWVRLTNNALRRQQILAIIYKKILHVTASWNPYLFSIIFSIIALVLTMTVSGLAKFPHIHSSEIDLNPALYSSRKFYALVYVSEDVHSYNFFLMLQQTSEDFEMNDLHITRNTTASEFMIHPELHSISFRERYFMTIDILKNHQIKIMYSPILLHSSPIALNLFHNTLLRYLTKRDDLRINLKSRPLIHPEHWQYEISHGKGVKNWENAVIITTLFLLLPSVDLGLREASSSSKILQLNTKKMTSLIYWIPTYCIDILIFMMSLVITAVTSFLSYHHIISISTAVIIELCIIFLFYGATAIVMGYCVQLWIKKIGNAYLTILIINLISALMINPELIFPLLLSHIDIKVQEYMEIFFHVLPPYVFSCAIGNFIAINLYNEECAVENECDTEFAIEDPCCYNCGNEFCHKPLNSLTETNTESLFHHSVMSDLLLMASQTIFFYLILIICEFNNRRKWFISKVYGSATEITDDNIITEKKIINQLITNLENFNVRSLDTTVIVKDLSKYYGTKKAVRDISLRIDRNECYGILGMNGAGKTTIFQALIGQIKAKIDKAWIYGTEYSPNNDEFFGIIGYCPQKGGLFDFLTSRQSLYFFAAIRGVPWKFIRGEVDRWLDVFDMLEFENLMLKNCAWGVRRKVAVLQSLIGDLPVIFLDEPSSGMDIISRSSLDETLCQLCEMGTSILLTTHSIDEAEALCNRVGILVDGHLVTTGTCENLVEKQGNKYIITIILQPQASKETAEKINELVNSLIYSVQFTGRHLDVLTYEFPKTLDLEDVFRTLKVIKHRQPTILDYFINCQTLEQVFNYLSDRNDLMDNQHQPRETIIQIISQLIRRISHSRNVDV